MPARTQGEDRRPVDDDPSPFATFAAAPFSTRPPLYQDRYEHDACGIGFVAQKDGRRSNEVLRLAVTALVNHAHRGAVASDGKSGDGAGVLTRSRTSCSRATWRRWASPRPHRATWRWG